jgi:hypothetical protein
MGPIRPSGQDRGKILAVRGAPTPSSCYHGDVREPFHFGEVPPSPAAAIGLARHLPSHHRPARRLPWLTRDQRKRMEGETAAGMTMAEFLVARRYGETTGRRYGAIVATGTGNFIPDLRVQLAGIRNQEYCPPE